MMMISIEKNVGRPTSHRRVDQIASPCVGPAWLRAIVPGAGRCSRHDHRAVDDDAEVHRAEREQVRRMPRMCRPMKVASSESGITTATMAGGAEIAEEQIQHQQARATRPRPGCLNTV